LISALIVLVAIALGSAAGYAQGMGTRMSAQQTSEGKPSLNNITWPSKILPKNVTTRREIVLIIFSRKIKATPARWSY